MENTAILVRMTPELKDAVERAAESENRSVTNFITTLLLRELEGEREDA